MSLKWAAAIAALMVALRLILFDFPTFFELRFIANHDMHQGASLFATSLQSMRLSGDIAWWNPTSGSGYAQYYQELLSPLAPTLGHIVFIVWVELIFVLGALGLALPEYFQYLTITFIVFPFLYVLAFVLLCSQLFRSKVTVTLGAIVYTFSTIGLWHSAWYYFQESATLMFLLAAVVAFFRCPRPRRLLFVLAAALIQLASLNYWTLFNSWFVLIFLGSYVVFHRTQVQRAVLSLARMLRRWPVASVVIAAASCVAATLWIMVILATMREQSRFYQRVPFGLINALFSIRPAFFLSRVFHPDIEAVAPQPYNRYLTMHHAVYLGAFLAPLLLSVSFYRLRRLERFLVIAAGGLLVICFALYPVQWAWEHVPWMNKIRHLFMFYPAYVRLVLLLLGCAGFDRVLEGRSVEAPRRSLAILVLGSAAVLYFGGWGFDRLARLGGAPPALLVLVPCAILGLVVLRPSHRNRALLGGALLLVALVDLCSYFRQVSQLDGDFTATRRFVARPLPPPVVQALKRVWAPLDPERPSTLFDNMPINTGFWPVNTYMPHIFLAEVPAGDPDPWTGTFIGFHPVGDPTWTSRMARDVLTPLPHEWRQRDYNAWKVVVDAPSAGWLSVAQLYDPGWRATVDQRPVAVQRANVVRSAVPVNGGRHEVEMVYRPLSRRLYWPASAALQLTLLLIAVAASRARSYRAINFRPIFG